MIFPRFATLILAWIILTSSVAAEGESIGALFAVKFADIALPLETLKKEFNSGLPNQLRYIISVNREGQAAYRDTIIFNITYDLWDEQYFLSNGHNSSKNLVFKNFDKLMTHLRNYQLKLNLANPKFKSSSELDVWGKAILNPVNDEKIKRIQKWIEQNNHGYSQTNNSFQVAKNIGDSDLFPNQGPRFKGLFDKILEQYLSSEKLAGQWQSKLTKMTASRVKR